ncbi:MAG: GNAT family N-acetyltransferase [Oscillospiraceae bacterium]|jgi:GNAT superfamily N-acetyltransferase|nr:GNAT family N-acetyltransferase [Oscillospiraceae bacterium]
MIRLTEEITPAFADFCRRDFFGLRILGWAKRQLPSCFVSSFYSQYNAADNITAVMQITQEGSGYISASGDADWEELVLYLGLFRSIQLQCAPDVEERLCAGGRTAAAGRNRNAVPLPRDYCLMRWPAGGIPRNAGEKSVRNADAAAVYRLLKAAGADWITDGQEWTENLAKEIRHGEAECFFAQKDGKEAAVCCVLARYEGFAYLGNVGSLPEVRGTGIAGALVGGIAAAESSKGHTVYLTCKKHNMRFYEKSGFVTEMLYGGITQPEEAE